MWAENLISEKPSFLHRLNPLSKVVATFPVAAFLTLTTNIWTPMVFIVFTILITMILGRVTLKRYFKTCAPMLLFFLGFILFYPFMVSEKINSDSQVFLSIGSIQIYEAGVLFGLATGLRLFSLLVLSMLFTLTTDSADFIRALVQQWKVNYRLGYGTLAVFRFIPILNKQFKLVKLAQQVRGYNGKEGYYRFVERTKRYALPLLSSALRHAERAAYSMDSRAFGAFSNRTYYRSLTFSFKDFMFISFFWIGSLLMILILHHCNLLGEISLFKMYD